MKKIFLFMLAALTLVSCSKDDDNDNKDEVVIPDYASYIDMSYANMIKSLGDPEMAFGDFYSFTYETGNVTGLTIMVNSENQKVYSVMEIFKENAYTAEQLQTYFASKYISYGKDDEGCYIYGNTKSQDDATVFIELSGNTSVSYSNPKNEPEAQTAGSIDGTPVEVMAAVLGQDLDDLLDEYSDAIVKYGSFYMVNYEDDEYLMSVALTLEDNVVTGAIILYNEGLSDEDIIGYYTEEGYTCMPTGNTDEEGNTQYMFANVETGVFINYCACRGVVTDLSSMDADEDDVDEVDED